jgi:hypothetical protein
MLIAAQQTQEASFPVGQLQAHVTQNTATTERHATVFNIWSGRNSYVEAKIQGSYLVTDAANLKSDRELFQIYTPEKKLLYSASSKLLRVDTIGKFRGEPFIQLWPTALWYRQQHGRRTWQELLTSFLESDSTDHQLSVADSDDGIVVVERKYLPGDASLTIRFSLAHGGNVLEFANDGPARVTTMRERGAMEWQETGDGRWYLSRFETLQIPAEDGDDLANAYQLRVEVNEFDPSPTIPDNRFQQRSLPLKPGTLVEEVGATVRRYRLGGDVQGEVSVTEDQFDTLTQELRKGRFAGANTVQDKSP